jgi:hypothetical protein
VVPIANQHSLCFLVSALHLLLRDKQLTKANATAPQDLQLVARVLSALDHRKTDIMSIFRALNASRTAAKMAPWILDAEGNDFEALTYLLSRLSEANGRPLDFLTTMEGTCVCTTAKSQLHWLVARMDAPAAQGHTTVEQLLLNHKVEESCTTCLSQFALHVNASSLPNKLFLNLATDSQATLGSIRRLKVREFERLAGRSYRLQGVTQYNASTRHFRTIRKLYADGNYRWYLLDKEASPLEERFPESLNPTQQSGWVNSVLYLQLSNEPSRAPTNSAADPPRGTSLPTDRTSRT